MDNTYCVYIHTNKINNKKYIGQTVFCDNPNIRWQNGFGYKKQRSFWMAIEKYGWNNFTHEIVADNLTKEKANELEMSLIKQFDTTNRDNGYNVTAGGEGTLGYHLSEETKQKISQRKKGKYCGENNPNFGNIYSEEVREKISQNRKDRKPVICVESNVIYTSMRKAEKQTGVSRKGISNCCIGKQDTAGGFHWKRAVCED